MTNQDLLLQLLARIQEKYELPSQWKAIQHLSKQTAVHTRTIQSWLAGTRAPHPRNRQALEWMLDQLSK